MTSCEFGYGCWKENVTRGFLGCERLRVNRERLNETESAAMITSPGLEALLHRAAIEPQYELLKANCSNGSNHGKPRRLSAQSGNWSSVSGNASNVLGTPAPTDDQTPSWGGGDDDFVDHVEFCFVNDTYVEIPPPESAPVIPACWRDMGDSVLFQAGSGDEHAASIIIQHYPSCAELVKKTLHYNATFQKLMAAAMQERQQDQMALSHAKAEAKHVGEILFNETLDNMTFALGVNDTLDDVVVDFLRRKIFNASSMAVMAEWVRSGMGGNMFQSMLEMLEDPFQGVCWTMDTKPKPHPLMPRGPELSDSSKKAEEETTTTPPQPVDLLSGTPIRRLATTVEPPYVAAASSEAHPPETASTGTAVEFLHFPTPEQLVNEPILAHIVAAYADGGFENYTDMFAGGYRVGHYSSMSRKDFLQTNTTSSQQPEEKNTSAPCQAVASRSCYCDDRCDSVRHRDCCANCIPRTKVEKCSWRHEIQSRFPRCEQLAGRSGRTGSYQLPGALVQRFVDEDTNVTHFYSQGAEKVDVSQIYYERDVMPCWRDMTSVFWVSRHDESSENKPRWFLFNGLNVSEHDLVLENVVLDDGLFRNLSAAEAVVQRDLTGRASLDTKSVFDCDNDYCLTSFRSSFFTEVENPVGVFRPQQKPFGEFTRDVRACDAASTKGENLFPCFETPLNYERVVLSLNNEKNSEDTTGALVSDEAKPETRTEFVPKPDLLAVGLAEARSLVLRAPYYCGQTCWKNLLVRGLPACKRRIPDVVTRGQKPDASEKMLSHVPFAPRWSTNESRLAWEQEMEQMSSTQTRNGTTKNGSNLTGPFEWPAEHLAYNCWQEESPTYVVFKRITKARLPLVLWKYDECPEAMRENVGENLAFGSLLEHPTVRTCYIIDRNATMYDENSSPAREWSGDDGAIPIPEPVRAEGAEEYVDVHFYGSFECDLELKACHCDPQICAMKRHRDCCVRCYPAEGMRGCEDWHSALFEKTLACPVPVARLVPRGIASAGMNGNGKNQSGNASMNSTSSTSKTGPLGMNNSTPPAETNHTDEDVIVYETAPHDPLLPCHAFADTNPFNYILKIQTPETCPPTDIVDWRDPDGANLPAKTCLTVKDVERIFDIGKCNTLIYAVTK